MTILLHYFTVEHIDENKTYSGKKISLKIPFTPHTNLTQAIMQKANRTFASLAQVMMLAQQVAEHSQYFLENFPPSSKTLETIKTVLYYSNNLQYM